MKVTIHPSGLNGTVRAPASKSMAQRALAAALLRKGESVINYAGESEDVKAAIEVISRLGATVKQDEDSLAINSNGIAPRKKEINCGESGLALRMFTPIAAMSSEKLNITGEDSLLERPMHEFDAIFSQAGILWKSNNGKLPFTIQGPLPAVDINTDGSLSSQFLTGLLMAYSALNAKATIHVKGLKSRPYIDMTLSMLRHFGMPVPVNQDYSSFIFNGEKKNETTNRISYTVEGDWSGAAFLLVAGAIAGPVTVTGLDVGSSQADRMILDVLMQANAGIAIDAKGIVVHPSSCNAFEVDATECPDLFPPLVALATYCNGESVIGGVERLVHKESNRAEALVEEFEKMGADIRVENNNMFIRGGRKLKGAEVHSHGDHRIAMACAVAALGAEGETVIRKAGAVRKSYPTFFHDLEKLGGNVSLKKKFRWHE